MAGEFHGERERRAALEEAEASKTARPDAFLSYLALPSMARLDGGVTGREINFEVTNERGAAAFVAKVEPSDIRRLVKEVDEAKELGWLRAGEARWTAVYDFLERVLGPEQYERLRELVAGGLDENGYADDGDSQLDEIVDHLLARSS